MCGSLLRPDSHTHLLNASNLKIAERRMLEEKVGTMVPDPIAPIVQIMVAVHTTTENRQLEPRFR